MVTQTFITNTDSIYTVGDNYAALAEGEIALIDADTGLAIAIDATATLPDGEKLLYFQQKRAAGEQVRISKPFKFKQLLKNYAKLAGAPLAPQAAVQQQSTLTFTVTTVGDVTVKFVDVTEGWEPFPRENFSIEASQYTDANSLATAVRDAINAKATSSYSATAASNVVTVTHKTAGNSFQSAFNTADDAVVDMAVAVTATPEPGRGLATQVAEWEKQGEYVRGRQSTNYFPQDFGTDVVGGATYHEYIFDITNDNSENVLRENKYSRIRIFVNAAASTALAGYIDRWVDATP